MSDMYFENLPSTSTPITAENLNKLNDIKVSSTQPNTGEKVWFKSGKNLFNANDIIVNMFINNDNTTGTSTVTNTSGFIGVRAGKVTLSYSYSTLGSSNERGICFYNKNKLYVSGTTYNVTHTTTQITVPQDGYMRFSYDKNCSNIQLEQGNVATSYEAYVEKEIYIKNNNGVYEEFYSKNDDKKIFITSLLNGATVNLTYWRNILVKHGNICHLELAVKPNSTNEITILQLPNNFYSTGNTSVIGLIQYQTTIGRLVIENSGAVKIQVPSNSTNTWNLNATWYVD